MAEEAPPTYEETKELTGGGDGPEVKITGGDTKIDMGKEQDQGFQGLSKEELMKYANDPFWVRLRWALFIFFWIIWVAMLVASIVIIVYAPKCPSPEPKSWWHKNPFYKVDLDEEAAIPNIQKLTENLDYYVQAGVGTLYITSFYPSDLFDSIKVPSEVAIQNYQDVDAKYGTLDDWAALLRGLKERDQKVLLDFIPNHTSDKHEWFVKSVAKDPDFDNFYIWADEEPAESAGEWTWSETRGAWYLSKLGSPDLNLSNKAVIAKLEEVLKFWLDTGVDGFVVNHLPYLVDDDSDLVSILGSFRTVVDEETEKSESPKVLVASSALLDPVDVPRLTANATGILENNVGRPLHLVFSESINDYLTDNGFTSKNLKDAFDKYQKSLPANVWPTNCLSYDKFGADMSDALTMFKMMLPATSMFSAGAELGLGSLDMAKVEEQKKAEKSHLKLFTNLAQKLRNQDAILFGELNTNTTFVKDDIFGMTRVKKGNPGYLLLMNFGERESTVNLEKVQYLPDKISVMEKSVKPVVEGEKKVSRYESKAVTVDAKEGKIFTFVPKFKKD